MSGTSTVFGSMRRRRNRDNHNQPSFSPVQPRILASGTSLKDCIANLVQDEMPQATLDWSSVEESAFDLDLRRWTATFRVEGDEVTSYQASGTSIDRVWQTTEFGLEKRVPTLDVEKPSSRISSAPAGKHNAKMNVLLCLVVIVAAGIIVLEYALNLPLLSTLSCFKHFASGGLQACR